MSLVVPSPTLLVHQLSNYHLPLDEAEQILMLQDQLLAADQHIAHLYSCAQTVDATRGHLLTSIAFLQSLNAPISRLPVEIISMIFAAFFALEDTGLRFLKLGLVCRSWKRILESTPQLWTRFTVSFKGPMRSAPLRRWLQRAGSCPIELIIDLDARREAVQPNAGEWKDMARDVCLVFAKHSWKSLTARFDGDHVSYPILSPFINHLGVNQSRKTLEKIVFDVCQRFDRPPVPLPNEDMTKLADVLKDATSLVTCELPSGLAERLHPVTLSRLPALGLTTLGVDELSLPKVLPILNNSTFLCSLSLDENGMVSRLGLDLVFLPYLERLSVSRWTDLADLFEKLRMPKLRSLAVDTVRGHRCTSNLTAAFRKLLKLSSPQLKELELTATPLSENELIKTLEKVPTLETLRIADTMKLTAKLFAALETDSGGLTKMGWLCPNLRVLEVGGDCHLILEKYFVSLVRARVLEVSAAILREVVGDGVEGISSCVKMLEVVTWKGEDMIRQGLAAQPVAAAVQPVAQPLLGLYNL